MPIMKSVYEILRCKFPEKEYALLQEVSDAAGFSRSRSADYMIMSLYPSRGNSLSGVELKSHRGDWLNELKKPDKAENIFQYCDYFWLLTDGDNIAKLEEIPETWGWMSIKGGRISIMKVAPKLSPKPITKSFLAALLKRATDKSNFIHRSSIEGEIKNAVEQGINKRAANFEDLKNKYDELSTYVSEFEKATGITLNRYVRWKTSPAQIGQTVKLIENGGTKNIEKDLAQLQTTAKDIHERISAALENLKLVNEFVETNQ